MNIIAVFSLPYWRRRCDVEPAGAPPHCRCGRLIARELTLCGPCRAQAAGVPWKAEATRLKWNAIRQRRRVVTQ